MYFMNIDDICKLGFKQLNTLVLDTKYPFMIWCGHNIEYEFGYTIEISAEGNILTKDSKSVYIQTFDIYILNMKKLMADISNKLKSTLVTTEEKNVIRVRINNTERFNYSQKVLINNLYICIILSDESSIIFLGSDSIDNVNELYKDEHYQKFKRVCVKVKYLREGMSGNSVYDNLEEWLTSEENYLATRQGRVFINKISYHYDGSILCNPYTIKRYGREGCLSLYLSKIQNPTEEMLNELYILVNSNIKYIGCYCNPDEPCHVDILIERLHELMSTM